MTRTFSVTGNVAFIPAKGFSSRIPMKNIRAFHGRPIIAYSIEAALQSELFSAVYVLTDDESVAEVAEANGARVMMRPQWLSSDTVGPHDVARWAVGELVAQAEMQISYVACIYATAPLMSVRDLKRGYDVMRGQLVDYAVSVAADPAPLTDAAQFIWAESGALLAGLPLWEVRTTLLPIAAERVCDVNTMEDWARCEAMYGALKA